MKKILLLTLIIQELVFAIPNNLNIKRISNVLSSIKADNEKVLFYSPEDMNLSKEVKFGEYSRATIILFPKKRTYKATIVDSYKKLKKDKNAIGAIFMKKGRTQIVFVSERLDKRNFKFGIKKHIISESQIKE